MENSTTIDAGGWLSRAKKRLAHSDNPELEAQLLLARVLVQTRASVLAHPDRELTDDQFDELEGLLTRLAGGEPLPYLLGIQEFYGMEFAVNPAVLIPRPETELLVETALNWLQQNPKRRLAADVGTGSGCIAVVLACHILDLTVIALDRSRKALETARLNFGRHQVESRIHMIQTDLLNCLCARFDLVCANLPYIPTKTLENLEVRRHEPALALDGGVDGLKHIRGLLQDSPRWMAAGGLMLLEIEAGQAESVPALADQILGPGKTSLLFDLAGLPRLITVQF